jgi:hypothetical protein
MLTGRSWRRSKKTGGGNFLINAKQKSRENHQIIVFYGMLYSQAAKYTEDMERCPMVDVHDGSPRFAFSAYNLIPLQTFWPKPASPKRSSWLPTFVGTEWADDWRDIHRSTLESKGNDWRRRWGGRDGPIGLVCVICGLFGDYTASWGNYLPTFRDNVSVPSSRVEIPRRKGWLHGVVR